MGVKEMEVGAQVCKFKEKPEKPADPSLTVAKWLVPTAGILFGLVGYVIDAAHRSLLAFPTDDGRLDDGGRVQDAAEFLRFIFTLIGDRLLTLASFGGFSLGGNGWLLLTCTALVAAVLAANFLREPERKGVRVTASVLRRALPLLVVGLITVKFVYFDAPVMRIESVVVEIGVPEVAVSRALAASASASAASASLTRPLADRLKGSAPAPVGNVVSDRAYALWRLMACSRIGGESATLEPAYTLAAGARCDERDESKNLVPLSKRTAEDTLAGEFDAALWIGALIVVVSAALLLRRTVQGTALAVIALAYLLTIPYSWGKLLKPVDFSYAQVRGVKDTFLAVDDQGNMVDTTSTFAFVLGRDAGAVTLLQGVRERCSHGNSTALRFSSVPSTKIVAIEQIFRLDVIEWALRTQSNCPIAKRPSKAS